MAGGDFRHLASLVEEVEPLQGRLLVLLMVINREGPVESFRVCSPLGVDPVQIRLLLRAQLLAHKLEAGAPMQQLIPVVTPPARVFSQRVVARQLVLGRQAALDSIPRISHRSAPFWILRPGWAMFGTLSAVVVGFFRLFRQ